MRSIYLADYDFFALSTSYCILQAPGMMMPPMMRGGNAGGFYHNAGPYDVSIGFLFILLVGLRDTLFTSDTLGLVTVMQY
jgi:hypothetical protein